jgi:hypothetical protein
LLKQTFTVVSSAGESNIVLDNTQDPAALSTDACGKEGPTTTSAWVILAAAGHYAFGKKPQCTGVEWCYSVALAHGLGHEAGFLIHTNASPVDIMGSPSSGVIMSSALLDEIIAWWYAQTPGAKIVQ